MSANAQAGDAQAGDAHSDETQDRRDVRLANEAWEALFRAQAVLARRFRSDDVWHEASPSEYDVLYTLARAERAEENAGPHGLSMVEINREVLLTQGGISRLIARLLERGLLRRQEDPRDRRTARILLTAKGRAVQRAVGRRHAQAVTATMSGALTPVQLQQLQQLCAHLSTALREQAS